MITGDSHIKYGKALYKVAKETGADKDILHDLEDLQKLVEHGTFKEIVSKLSNVKKSQGEEILKAIFADKVHSLTLNLLLLLNRNGKLFLLDRAASIYRQLYNGANDIDDLKVTTAKKLTTEEEHEITKALKEKKDKAVSVRFDTNSKLIGGIQIYEKGFLQDFSLRNYLDILERELSK